MNRPTEDPRLTYAEALSRAADDLDDALGRVRAGEAAGRVTTVEAAAQRCALLERHLERLADLRREHSGDAR